MVDAQGVWPYTGVGASSPGAGFNITYSTSNPTQGCTTAFSTGLVVGGSADTGGNIEAGIIYPFSVSALEVCTGAPMRW